MEVRGQHQALATLPPRKQPLLLTKCKAGWASEPVWMHWMVVTVIQNFKCTLIMTYTVLDYHSPLHSK
jgi:hypothetical protein